MKNPTFLSDCAKKILLQHPAGVSEITVIVPGKRAGRVLKTELARVSEAHLVAPKILSVGEWMQEVSGMRSAAKPELMLLLYRVYEEIFESESYDFSSFLPWGSRLLGDFNTIDNYLLSPKELFRNLKDYRELESWSFHEEELTDAQQRYNHFWARLGDLYEKYNTLLAEKGLSTTGQVVRGALTEMQKKADGLQDASIYILGLNVLTPAEQQVFSLLEKKGKATFLWDGDGFYVKDKMNEAGLFFRKQANKDYAWPAYFATAKDFHIHELSSQSAELERVADLMKSAVDPQRSTAIVLADENLLIPLLHTLPIWPDGVNITMGYPLTSGVVADFLNKLKDRLLAVSPKVHFVDFLALWQHPMMRVLCSDISPVWNSALADELQANNMVFITEQWLREAFLEKGVVEWMPLFFPSNETAKWLEDLLPLFEEWDPLFEEAEKHAEREQLYIIKKLMLEVAKLELKYPVLAKAQHFVAMLEQYMSKETLDFFGEPLLGLQILGMLETRALDFEHIILVGANESILPGGQSDISFIPYELRQHYQLPTQREREAVFAYYTYRLFQRAKRVDMVYSSVLGGMQMAEKSRYVQQLEQYAVQQPKWNWYEEKSANYFMEGKAILDSIEKTPELLQKIKQQLERGMSPSGINTFVRCPLDFYYQYLVGLREQEKLEEQIEASTFGTVVHDTLEELYTPFVGKILHAKDVDGMMLLSKGTVHRQMLTHFPKEGIAVGINHLAGSMAAEYVERFLKLEMKQLHDWKKEEKYLTIVALEEDFEVEVKLEKFGLDQRLKLRGKIDRVERLDGVLRIVDYKTGRVDQSNVKLKWDEEEPEIEEKQAKALQLLIYAYGWARKHPHQSEGLVAGNISFKNLSAGLIEVEMNGSKVLGLEQYDLLEKALALFAAKMLNPDLPLLHHAASQYCDWCGG